MKQCNKWIVSLLLALVMVCGMVLQMTTNAFAAENQPIIPEGWTAVPISTEDVSAHLAYKIESGVLAFHDFGDPSAEDYGRMPSYTNSSVVETKYNITEWYQNRSQITAVVFDESISYIGSYVLTNMDQVEEICIENSDTQIVRDAVLFSTTSRDIPLKIYAASTITTTDLWIRGNGNRPLSEAISNAVMYYTDLEHLAPALKELEGALATGGEIDATLLYRALELTKDLPKSTYTISDYRCAVPGAEEILDILWKLSSGSCGENVTYRLCAAEEEGLLNLIIEGNGAMEDYDYISQTPWENVSECISDVTIGEGVTDIPAGVLPTDAVYHVYLNSDAYAYAAEHGCAVKLAVLRILCIGNSHTVDWSEFRANIQADLEQAGMETKVEITRATIGSIGLYSGRNSNVNATYRSHLEALQNEAGAYASLKSNRYDLIIVQDYLESVVDEPAAFVEGLASFVRAIKDVAEEHGKGAPQIAWFADWVDIRTTGSEKSLYDGEGNKIKLEVLSREQVYAKSLASIAAVEGAIDNGDEDMPDFVIHASTIKQNAMSSYLGTTKQWGTNYCLLERDTTHLTYELGRYLMGAGVFSEVVNHYAEMLELGENGTDVGASLTLDNSPKVSGTGSQYEGTVNNEILEIIREAISSPDIFRQSAYTVDPIDVFAAQLSEMSWDTELIKDEESALNFVTRQIDAVIGGRIDAFTVVMKEYRTSNDMTVVVRLHHGYSIYECEVIVHQCRFEAVLSAPTCAVQGYTTYTCSCGESYVADYVDATGEHIYVNAVCSVCGENHPNLENYSGKVISVLSASTSTFAGYIPTADGFNLEHRARYPQDNLLTDVNDTWWMQTITALAAKLGINDSWAGSQVLNTLDSNSGDLGPDACMASLARIQNLGSNGTPDVILFFGGGNDIGRGVPVGSFDPNTAPTEVDLTTTKWETFADAYVAAIMRLQYFYPDAEIVSMRSYEMPTYVTAKKLDVYGPVIQAICDHYGITCVNLRDCGVTFDMLPDGIHPNAEGMDYITADVLDTLLNDVELDAGENVVYTVTHNLTNAAASRHYYKGASAGQAFTEVLNGKDLTVSVLMGGEDVTGSAYSNGTIYIPAVTGELVITATGSFDADGHLQQLPENYCSATNLWAALTPENIYYTASGWGNTGTGNSWSITFPVKAGDRIWATSIGAYPGNGSTANGVRVTWFDKNGVLVSMSRETVYAEFAKNGYITAPEGAVALNLPMTNNQDHYAVYMLSAEHTYKKGVCTACGAEDPDAGEAAELKGKTISILGASISTYMGISNNAEYNSTIGNNAVYSTEGRYGVYADDTWWMQAANDLGLELLVNNSWSGSSLLHERNGTVGAYVDRCVQLHNNEGKEPDIIAIQMGTNDFQYYKETLGTADIDYTALISRNDDGSYTYAEPTTSLEAAAIVLHKISVRYPDAEVYYLNISQRIDGTDDLIRSFNAELQEVVEYFGAHIVDIYGSAITMDDFSTYIGDGRVHPNKLGMDAYTEAFKRALISNTEYAVETYTVSLELDDITADYGDDKIVVSGDSFTVCLESNDGINVRVTMGGEDITSEAYADGVVTIDAVTADVTIFAEYTHAPQEYRWEFDGAELTAVLGDNVLTKESGTTADGVFSNTSYSLKKAVVLRHDHPWVVEWECEGTFQNTGSSTGARIFTSTNVNTEYNARYIFKSNKNGIIAMGEKTATGSHNYGIALGDYGIDWTARHTYRLENRICADGSNMIYLSVDGVELGALNHYYVGTTDKNTTSNWLSGKDFVFPYMGTDTHGFTNASIEYIQVSECIHTYEKGACIACGAEQPAPIIITQQPADIEAAFGDRYCVAVEAEGEGLKYQWYFRNKGSSIWYKSGVRDNTYDDVMTIARNGREVYCVITDAKGNSITSDVAKLIAVPSQELAIVSQPVDGEAVLGEYYCVAVEAVGDGLTYQWYFRNAGSDTWYKSGVRDNTYDDVMTRARADREIYCIVTDAFGNSISTDVVKLNRIPVKLKLASQPMDSEVALGERYSVSVEAVGEGLRYQWYFRNAGEEKFTASSVRGSTYSDVMTRARADREIYCVITDEWGDSVTTDVVTISRVHLDLEIITQPTDEVAVFGERFCATVEAVGDGLKYQWYFRNAGSDTWYKSGVRDNTYDDVMTRDRMEREIYCVITDEWGNSVATDTVTLIAVPSQELAITGEPADTYAAMGEYYCVSVEAVGDGLKYQWYFRNAGSDTWYKSGVRDSTYDDVMTKERANREVYCVITDAFGNQVVTDVATLVLIE